MSDFANDEILKDFILETKSLIAQMQEILQEAEEDITLAPRLENYGQMVDRIMGGAKIMAIDVKVQTHPIHKIADYTAICKAVGYKTSQIKDNLSFYQICVAFLMDATDVLSELMNTIESGATSVDMKDLMSQTLIDRLKWVSGKFSSEYRESVAVKPQSNEPRMTQDEIDKLIAKLGL